MHAIRRLAVVVTLAASALAPSHASAQQKIKKERDRISREEILASAQKDGDLLAAIQALRPKFLEPPRGIRDLGGGPMGGGSGVTQTPMLVVIDGNRSSGTDILKSIQASMVDEVRWYEPSKAQNEYGQTGASGAILVKMFDPQKVTKQP